MLISVVIPLLNEEENVEPLLEKISISLSNFNYEIILIDDGSTDNTVKNIKNFADKHVKLLVLSKNYGQTTALAAGIDEADGDYIVTMDGDLQNDPNDIRMMIEKLKNEELDLIVGIRSHRKDSLLIRKFPSKIANFIIRVFTGVKISDYGCTLKVFKSHIAKNLGLYGELHRFIPVLAKLVGARIGEIGVNHHARIHGKSKYGLGRSHKVISDLILMIFFQKYFHRPIHIFGPVGFVTLMIGIIINIYLLILKIMNQDIWGKPLLLLGVILTLGGIQILTFGIMIEIMIRTYFESQQKKTYIIKERVIP